MPADQFHQFLLHLRTTAFTPEAQSKTDGQLLHCFLTNKTEAAFEVLLRRHGRMVLGVCQRILKHSCDAEDAFQATFLILLSKAGSLLGRQTVGDWLYGVARHTALKARAAIQRRQAVERRAMETAARHLPVEEIIWEEWRPLLDQEVERLPARYRTLIVLCHLEQKSHKEVAALLGCTTGTVAGQLSRARDLLARRLKRYSVTLPVAALAALLTQNGGAASLTPSLVASTVQAASLVAAGQAASGAASASVAALKSGVLQAMWRNTLKKVLVMVFLVAGVCTTTSTLLHYALAAKSGIVADGPAKDGKGPDAGDPKLKKQPVAAQGPALARDLLLEGKVTIWGTLFPNGRHVNVGMSGLLFVPRFPDKKVAEAAGKLKGKYVRIAGNLKVTAQEPRLLQLEVSEIKPGEGAAKELPDPDPYSAFYKVEGEVVLRARLNKGDPKLKSDATLATGTISQQTPIGTMPIFFERKHDKLHGFDGFHQAVLGEAKKELAKKAAALQDRAVLVRAALQGHRFLTRAEYIAYIIKDIQPAN